MFGMLSDFTGKQAISGGGHILAEGVHHWRLETPLRQQQQFAYYSTALQHFVGSRRFAKG
jgi:hypothetical protein